ncbi:MAG: PLP-dependent aminotransferase family protein [Marmoricola sp.]
MQRVLSPARLAALLGDFDRSPAWRGLADALRDVISDGRVPVGMRLPSERDLTTTLGLSRTTVTRAYAELRDQGFLTSRQGSGSEATLPQALGRGDHLLTPGGSSGPRCIDLTCAAGPASTGLGPAYQKALEELPAYLATTGYYPSGLPELQDAIAATYAARGLPTAPEQIVVTPGALAAVAIAARAILESGSRTLAESPTYPNAIATLQSAPSRVVGVDADAGSWGASISEAIRQVRPAAAYLVPDFHNPTGLLRDEADRERVAAAARKAGTVLITDESLYLLDLRGPGASMPAPLANQITISVGGLSKAYWGGLRVGWLRVPPSMLDPVIRSRIKLDLGAPVLEQLVALELLRDGYAGVAHRRAHLTASRDALLAALSTHLPDWEVPSPAGGLSVWCRLPEARSSALVAAAERHDVLLAAGPLFAPEGGLDRFLRIPFAVGPEAMTEGVRRIGAAWADVQNTQGRGRRAPSRTLVA